MKKYIITSAIMLAAMTSATAEEVRIQETASVKAGKAVSVTSHTSVGVEGMSAMKEIGQVMITTGDSAIDAQIKALQAEMEVKIKTIRDDYRAKIKVIIGDKKVITGRNMMEHGSSTMRVEGKGEGRYGMGVRGSSTMIVHHEGRMVNGSGTPEDGRPPMMHEGKQIPEGMQVRGESTGAEGNEGVALQVTVKGFFNKFFGR